MTDQEKYQYYKQKLHVLPYGTDQYKAVYALYNHYYKKINRGKS